MSSAAGVLGSVAVRAAVVWFAAAVMASLLAGRSAALRHAVWTAAVLGALATPIAHLALPGWRGPVALHTAWAAARTAARAVSGTTFDAALRRDRTPAVRAARPARTSRAPAALLGVTDLVSADARPDPGGAGLGLGVLLVWGAGVALVGLRAIAAAVGARRLACRARAVTDARLCALARAAAAAQGLAAPPALRETDDLSAPATVGVRHPVVLLPPGAAAWTTPDAAAVLAHEVAHVARRDGLTQALAALACAVYWFNPLAWLAARRMRLERERACDDRVLVAGARPDAYAALLVAAARAARGAHGCGAPRALLALARPSELETRVRAILSPAVIRGRPSGAARHAVAATAVALVGSVAVVQVGAASAVTPVAPAIRTYGVAPDARGVRSMEPGLGPPSRAGDPTRAPLVALPAPARLRAMARDDSVARPESERLPGPDLARAASLVRAATAGPDSALVGVLRAALARPAGGRTDLVAERAAWALARTRADGLIPPLVDALGDPDWRVRAYAAWALGEARDTTRLGRAVPALAAQLAHPVWRLRAMAASALADLGDARARPAVNAVLGDPAWQVRVSAVRYVGRFRDQTARAAVRAALRDPHFVVRVAAGDAVAADAMAVESARGRLAVKHR